MKKIILSAAAALLLAVPAQAGDITSGSVPGSLNYQGRLERDNAPITGPIHLYFRVYNSATANNTSGGVCGGTSQPCLWQSPEITAQATQGIFSADITPPVSVLAGGQNLFLEVQVESDVLTPREPLNSVAFALVAKKLEDGSSVTVSTLTSTFNVQLATAAGAQMTVGTDLPYSGSRLTVDGWLKLTSGGIIFPDNSSMNVASVASAGNIANDFDADILADRDTNGTGAVIFRKPTLQFMRISNSGLVGIGPGFTALVPPMGRLDVDGEIYVGSEGIYPRDPGDVNIMSDLTVTGGRVTGAGSDYVSIGETNNVILFYSNGGERMRVHSNNFVGIGLNSPTAPLHVQGDILSNAGVRGGAVSIGTYTGWTTVANEVRAADNTHLLLQQSNSYNVGVGTNTPREKLHVRGSVLSDYGIIAATASFSGDVRVNGTLTANSGQGNTVNLSSTVIHGTLQVTGGIGSMAGVPVYLASTQTLTGQNTFLNQVFVSSDIYTTKRLGVGVTGFDFSGSRYLQVGDDEGGTFTNENGIIHLVGGGSANAKLNFYRGAAEAARLETQGAPNLALVVGGLTRTLTDGTYHRIQNSVLWVSTGYNTTPAVFVSSSLGNVGIGTSVMDPNWKLTVDGNLRLKGAGSALIFADGTSMTTSSATSANNLSANGDAIIQSNADYSGGGDVILRSGPLDGLIVNTGGNVGIGTMYPVSRLNVRGGDLVLGTPYNPYDGDSVPDLVVGGNIAFDGELVQRSAATVQLANLIVAGAVHLSTTTSARTGIGTINPLQKLQVAGDINIESGSGIRINNTATLANYLRGNGTRFESSAILDGDIPGTIVRTSRSIATTAPLSGGGNLSADRTLSIPGLTTIGTGLGNYTVGVNAAGNGWEYKNIVGEADEIDVAPAANLITIGIVNPLKVTKGGTGDDLSAAPTGGIMYKDAATTFGTSAALTGMIKGNGTGAPTAQTGTQNQVTRWASDNYIGASTILTDNGTRFTVGAPLDVTSYFTATSSATFKANGVNQYSIATSSGILLSDGKITVNNGHIDMTGGKIVNVGAPGATDDAATKGYVDEATGGAATSRGWSKLGNFVSGLDYMGSSNDANVIFKRQGAEIMKLISTGIDVTGNITLTGSVDGYDVSASGVNWNTAYTHSQDVTGNVHGATNASTANMIVRRDGSQNFSAGTITAALNGNANTATTASALATGATAGASAITAINAAATTIDWARVSKTGSNLNEIATRSHTVLTDKGTNTHADIDTHLGLTATAHGASTTADGTIVVRGATGNFTAGTITAALNGNANTATTAATADTLDNTQAAGNSAITAINLGNAGQINAARGGTGISGAGGTANEAMVTTNGTSWTTAKISSTYTSGALGGTFTVIASTQGAGSCYSMTVANGMVTALTGPTNCY